MPTEFIDSTPAWFLGVIAFALGAKYLLQVLVESSDTAAKLLGPLGRRWRDRADARTRRQRAERTNRSEKEAADITSLRRQVAGLSRQMEQFGDLRDYLIYDAQWHTTAELRAASRAADLPGHMDFEEWMGMRSYHGGGGVPE